MSAPEPYAGSVYGFRVFSIATGEAGSLPSSQVASWLFGGWMLGQMPPRPHRSKVITDLPDGGHLLDYDEYADRGMLRGPIRHEFVWGPGVNEGKCLVNYLFAPSEYKPESHGVPAERCHCGFWAYTYGDHALSAYGPSVLAVVQAGGRIVVGSKGFRAENARIVALCFPDSQTDEHVRRAEDEPKRTQAISDDLVYREPTTAADPETTDVVRHNVRQSWLRRVVLRRPDEKPDPRATVVSAWKKDWDPIDDDLRQAVMARYPVPVFSTIAAMQAEFPPTDPREFGEPIEEESAA